MAEQDALIEVNDLRVTFPVHGGVLRRRVAGVRAVDGVSFTIRKGEVLGLVGESGSGKTTVGRAIINLLTFTSPDVELGGSIRYVPTGAELNGAARAAMLPLRARIQMIFQDPYSSLNPRMTVEQIIDVPLRIHTDLPSDARRERMYELLERVGLQRAYAGRYPHEFSGGQRQRIGIARALATRPELVIADEPVSALDVSVQAQVINLMEELKHDFGLTYLFVAHDLSVVHHVSDRIAVMYLGSIVEIGPSEALWKTPRHPYTRALISAVPRPDPRSDRTKRVVLQGDIPTPLNKPTGCGFRTRCPIARESCAQAVPPLVDVGGGQQVACPHHAELD
ncbi:MAG: ATP-binding cassette domain-containing protein [Alphaproteobacteria bacterium]|nr:ATP-binding cassette domain-containing protein [Alphaproteobacteria bacterium]MCB9698397.1 ATP-binding cassette domain-containing protein [Alphaproteobacteria bacterium]